MHLLTSAPTARMFRAVGGAGVVAPLVAVLTATSEIVSTYEFHLPKRNAGFYAMLLTSMLASDVRGVPARDARARALIDAGAMGPLVALVAKLHGAYGEYGGMLGGDLEKWLAAVLDALCRLFEHDEGRKRAAVDARAVAPFVAVLADHRLPGALRNDAALGLWGLASVASAEVAKCGAAEAAVELALGSPRFAVGTAVEAKYLAGAAWYAGRISVVNEDGTFAVAFADGDFQPDVRAANIRASGAAATRADCANLYGAVGLLMRLTEHPRAYRPRAERLARAFVATLRNRKIQGVMRTLATLGLTNMAKDARVGADVAKAIGRPRIKKTDSLVKTVQEISDKDNLGPDEAEPSGDESDAAEDEEDDDEDDEEGGGLSLAARMAGLEQLQRGYLI